MLLGMLQHRTASAWPSNSKMQEAKGRAYQIFGFDILLDEDYKAWLLEINDHPSLDIYMCNQAMGCNHKFCNKSEVDM